MHSDGSGSIEKLDSAEPARFPQAWSPDGKILIFLEENLSDWDLWTLSLDGKHEARPWLRTPFAEWSAAFSPDGRWVAYVSDESGSTDVYVRPFNGSSEKLRISNAGGREPMWAHSGRELFYRDGNKMIAVSVETGSVLRAGKPRQLFEGNYQAGPGETADYDVAPGDNRFLMVQREQKPPLTHLEVCWAGQQKRMHTLRPKSNKPRSTCCDVKRSPQHRLVPVVDAFLRSDKYRSSPRVAPSHFQVSPKTFSPS
jgi:dipeptidyl aminopeptidase/acylaminoacyl peptidase